MVQWLEWVVANDSIRVRFPASAATVLLLLLYVSECAHIGMYACMPACLPACVYTCIYIRQCDSMAEWLRRVIRNHMGYARVGSNPTAVARSSMIFMYIVVVYVR